MKKFSYKIDTLYPSYPPYYPYHPQQGLSIGWLVKLSLFLGAWVGIGLLVYKVFLCQNVVCKAFANLAGLLNNILRILNGLLAGMANCAEGGVLSCFTTLIKVLALAPLAGFVMLVKFIRKGNLVDTVAAESKKSTSEVLNEAVEKNPDIVNEEKYKEEFQKENGREPTPKEIETMITKSLTNEVTKVGTDAISKQTVGDRTQSMKALETQYQEETAEFNERAEEEGVNTEETDKVADEISERPVFAE